MVIGYFSFLLAENGGPCGPGCMHTQLDVVGWWRPLVNGESLVLYLWCSAWFYSTANHLVWDYIPGSCRLHLNKALFTVSVLHLPAASAKFQCTINTCICQVSLNPLSACMNVFMAICFLFFFIFICHVVYCCVYKYHYVCTKFREWPVFYMVCSLCAYLYRCSLLFRPLTNSTSGTTAVIGVCTSIVVLLQGDGLCRLAFVRKPVHYIVILLTT